MKMTCYTSLKLTPDKLTAIEKEKDVFLNTYSKRIILFNLKNILFD